MAGKLYNRLLIKRVIDESECAIMKERCGFKSGRLYIVQVICVSQMCEKYFANGKDEIWAFMALKMVYDTIDRPACQMYRMRGVGGK